MRRLERVLGRGLGRSHGDLVAEVGEKRGGVPRSPTELRDRSWNSQVGSAEDLRAQVSQ